MKKEKDECLYALYHVRNSSNVPILVLQMDSDLTLLQHVYEIGADDVVIYPPNPTILAEKIKAMIRRYTEYLGATPGSQVILACKNLVVDPRARIVTRNGKRINLREREYDLLYYMAINRGQVLTYDMIYEQVWKEVKTPEENIVNHVSNLVRNLRIKIGEENRCFIENCRGYGYRYNPDYYQQMTFDDLAGAQPI